MRLSACADSTTILSLRRSIVATQLLTDAGFTTATTEIVHHVPAERPFEVAVAQGLLDRRSTSQLMVIGDADYESGIRRMSRERPVLRSDVRLFGTFAYRR